jgi:hypothetical protein
MHPVARLHEEIATRTRLNVLEEEIATLVARIDACEHELLTRLREFDATQGWVGRATSCARWLSWRTGLSMQAARDRVRVARALGRLPLVDEAMRRGELSYSKVRALTRVATPRTESKWIATARRVAADHLESLCRESRHLGPRAAFGKRADRRFVRRRSTPHGMVRIEIQLPPAEADLVWEAIVAATEAPSPDATSATEAQQGRVSASASAEASSDVAAANSHESPVQAPTDGVIDAPDPCAERRTDAEQAVQAVQAELRAAAATRSQPQARAWSPANDAPDLEEERADAIVMVAESFVRLARTDGRPEPPRPP